MAWPPAALPTNRTNATPQQDTHPSDHNAIALAINDTVGKLVAVDAAVRRYGFIAAQSGQTYNSGQVANIVFNTTSDATWGLGPQFTIPAGQAGVYAISLRVKCAAPAAGVFSDVQIVAGGDTYANAINPGKQDAAVSATLLFAVGDSFFCQFYNGAAQAASLIAKLTLLRVGT